LLLLADGQGNWRTGAGAPLPELRGALDVDLSASPFTNTLALRRLGLRTGESADIAAAYVAFPDLALSLDPQRYTCLAAGSLYRYQSRDSAFRADVAVDADCLVTDYPGLFRRTG